MKDLSIRPAKAGDLPQVLEMIRALAAHHGDCATLTHQTLERDVLCDTPWITVLVAETLGGMLGYAALCPLVQLQFGLRGMDMHHLYVVPEVRGQGIGSALIHASIAQAGRKGCRYMTVGTNPENTIAAEVYRAAGFEALPPPGPRFGVRLGAATTP